MLSLKEIIKHINENDINEAIDDLLYKYNCYYINIELAIHLMSSENKDIIKILCKAFWFSKRNSGNMSLDIKAYKGGAMQRDRSNHYQFINVGGEQVGNVISFPKNITMNNSSCMIGEIIGTVKYNRENQSLSFEE